TSNSVSGRASHFAGTYRDCGIQTIDGELNVTCEYTNAYFRGTGLPSKNQLVDIDSNDNMLVTKVEQFSDTVKVYRYNESFAAFQEIRGPYGGDGSHYARSFGKNNLILGGN